MRTPGGITCLMKGSEWKESDGVNGSWWTDIYRATCCLKFLQTKSIWPSHSAFIKLRRVLCRQTP